MSRHIVTFDDLVAIARRTGVRVVSAPSSHRGHIGEMGTVMGVTGHWTGTKDSFRPTDDYPDYNVVKEGRAGLDNSLSAFGLGRFTSIYVFSEDISWHAGTWYWRGVTDGNGHFLGIEAAGEGNWTPFQRRVYPRLVASALLFIDSGVEWFAAHAEGAVPHGRKTDFPTGGTYWLPDIPSNGRTFRQAVSWLLANPAYINVNYKGGASSTPTEEDFMATMSDKEKAEVLDAARGMNAFLRKVNGLNFQGKDWYDAVHDVQDFVVEPLDSLGTPGKSYTVGRFIQYIDRHVGQTNRVVLPWLVAAVEAVAAKVGATLPAKPTPMQTWADQAWKDAPTGEAPAAR